MNFLRKIMAPGAALPGEIEVEYLRNVGVRGQSKAAGEREFLPADIARQLIAEGDARDIKQPQKDAEKRREMDSLLPGPVEAKPLPQEWDDLPECFGRFWELNEKRRCLAERRDQTYQKALDLRSAYIPRVTANGPNANSQERRIEAEKLFAIALGHAVADNPVPPYLVGQLVDLEKFHRRIEQEIATFNLQHGDDLLRAKIECGDYALSIHSELVETCEQLSKTGFAIFQSRIGFLGLNEGRTRTLYAGSADYHRFEHSAPSLRDVQVGWSESATKTRIVKMGSVLQTVNEIRQLQPKLAKLKPLLAQGRKELKQAESVAA